MAGVRREGHLHAIAHLEENSNIAEIDRHRVDGLFVSSQFAGNTYRFTVEIRQPDNSKVAAACSYELSTATTQCLISVMEDVFAAIASADREMRSQESQ